jgi:DNA polymerase
MLAGQMDTIDDLRRGIDVYSSFASNVYQRPISKKDKKERQHGKVGMLQLQYQAGGKSFKNAARVMGGVRLSDDEAFATVDVYRNRFTDVRKFWRTCQQSIEAMGRGTSKYRDSCGLCRTEGNKIVMDGRMPLVYHNLRQELIAFEGQEPELQWVYDDKEKRYTKKIYGGSVTENLCQWVAGSIVKDQTLECERRWGAYHMHGNGVVNMVHDEAVLLVDEDDADECLKFCLDVFKQSPKWWDQLPVSGEGGHGYRYSECK